MPTSSTLAGPAAEIALHGVSKRFGEVTAVGDVSLDVPSGRTTVLIGPSGCGKSTILRLALGLLTPSSGSVTFHGAQVTPETALAVRRRTGYVIQEGGLFPHLTAVANVTLMARHLGHPGDEIARRVAFLCDLTHFPAAALERYPLELSGGQRQRVGVMRALMLDPEVLLLDEPLGALDPMVRISLQEELGAIFRRLGKTVLMVTHDLAEAAYFADSIVLMRAGRVVQHGTLDELRSRPAAPFVTSFIRAQRPPVAL